MALDPKIVEKLRFLKENDPIEFRKTLDRLKGLSTSDLVILRWHLRRRKAQTCPEPVPKIWWLLGGRGSGKTYTASNHIYEFSATLPFVEDNEVVYIALIGSIFDDVKATMIEGKSGLLKIVPEEDI